MAAPPGQADPEIEALAVKLQEVIAKLEQARAAGPMPAGGGQMPPQQPEVFRPTADLSTLMRPRSM